MELTAKQITLFIGVLLTGLSAGLFYAWAVSVIPGTRRVTDLAYLETMQSINKAIINPAFMIIFFGSVVLLGISTAQHYQSGSIFWVLLAATATYLIGTIGVTGMGNVPLNDALEVLKLDKFSLNELASIRKEYETPWNRLHMIRTVFSVLSFALALAAVFMNSRTNFNQ
uniref:anthrone oxygenase family protein n=1 Tax=Fulvivirga sp. TaxID=1931237 RepID=UPI00404ABCEF